MIEVNAQISLQCRAVYSAHCSCVTTVSRGWRKWGTEGEGSRIRGLSERPGQFLTEIKVQQEGRRRARELRLVKLFGPEDM